VLHDGVEFTLPPSAPQGGDDLPILEFFADDIQLAQGTDLSGPLAHPFGTFEAKREDCLVVSNYIMFTTTGSDYVYMEFQYPDGSYAYSDGGSGPGNPGERGYSGYYNLDNGNSNPDPPNVATIDDPITLTATLRTDGALAAAIHIHRVRMAVIVL
jgi:hypothetical protein